MPSLCAISPPATSAPCMSRSLLACKFAALRWLRAWPPLRPASRASSESNSCATPCACAARPPSAAIARCLAGSIDAKPRLLVPPPWLRCAMCVSPWGIGTGSATSVLRALGILHGLQVLLQFRQRVRGERTHRFAERHVLAGGGERVDGLLVLVDIRGEQASVERTRLHAGQCGRRLGGRRRHVRCECGDFTAQPD